MATLAYADMLISAGFITGTRTATVLQDAQKSAGRIARVSARSGVAGFVMVDFPEARSGGWSTIGSIAETAGSTPLLSGQAGGPAAVSLPDRLRSGPGQGSRKLMPLLLALL